MGTRAGNPHTRSRVNSNSSLAPCVAVLLFGLAGHALAQETAGWRTDGTGQYPSATPPVEWSPTKNVLWSTPLPSKSNASPVLLGDKLFVCAEPDVLLCVNAADGKILWQKTSSLEDASKPEDAAKIKQAATIEQQIQAETNELRHLNGQLKRDPANADLKKSADEKNAKLADLRKQIEPLKAFAPPPAHQFNGFSSSTPFTDGKNVYALFGSGVVACYDLAGTRLWIRKIENPRDGWGQSTSPILAGDKLLVHLTNLVALNAATGDQVWTANVQSQWGTPAVIKIGDTDAVLTPAGDIVRLSDGKVLASKLAFLKYASPLVQDHVAYFIDESVGKAVKLPEKIVNDTAAPELLWTIHPVPDRYYASPILHDGLLYAVTQKGDFSVFDAKTGAVVYSKQLDLGKGTYYPSVTLAGKYLYVSVDNGSTVVLEPGREYKEVHRNTLENFCGSPVFDGKRLYIRGYTKLYCIGE